MCKDALETTFKAKNLLLICSVCLGQTAVKFSGDSRDCSINRCLIHDTNGGFLIYGIPRLLFIIHALFLDLLSPIVLEQKYPDC
jgi:hypothetical protein